MKENDNRNAVEELCVLADEIRTLDVKQSIEQLLRSLRLKCQSLPKLPNETYFEMTYVTNDNSQVEGFDNPDTPPTGVKPFRESNKSTMTEAGTSGLHSDTDVEDTDEVLSMSMSGQDDLNLPDDKKLKAFIKTEAKSEPGIQSEVKTEPGIYTEIKQEPVN